MTLVQKSCNLSVRQIDRRLEIELVLWRLSSTFHPHFVSFTVGSIHGKENFKLRGEIPSSKFYDTKL